MPATWGRVPVWWVQRLRETGAGVLARDVLVVLAAHASKRTGECWPSQAKLAKTLRVTQRAIRGAVAELEAAGVIEVHPRNRRRGQSDLYKLATDDQPFTGTKCSSKISGTNPSCDNGGESDEKALDSEESPEQIVHDHRNTSCTDHVHGSCSNVSNNLPVEPTSRTTVLTTLVPRDSHSLARSRNGEKRLTNHDARDQLIELLRSGSRYSDEHAEKKADRLLHLFPDRPRTLIAHLTDGIESDIDSNGADDDALVNYVIRQTRRGESPKTRTEVKSA